MAVATSFSSAAAIASRSKTLNPPPRTLRSTLSFSSSRSLGLVFAAVRSMSVGGAAVAAKMVSAPAMSKPPSLLDFMTSIFKKEKINLAGHNEFIVRGICSPCCPRRSRVSSRSGLSGGGHRYHVPRSFLKEGEPNTLILFEEAGGEPFNVNFQTVAVGTICGHVEEGKTLTLSCQGTGTISNIEFASFGNPVGMCGAFQKGTCDSQIALDAIQKVFSCQTCVRLRG